MSTGRPRQHNDTQENVTGRINWYTETVTSRSMLTVTATSESTTIQGMTIHRRCDVCRYIVATVARSGGGWRCCAKTTAQFRREQTEASIASLHLVLFHRLDGYLSWMLGTPAKERDYSTLYKGRLESSRPILEEFKVKSEV